MKKTGIPSLNFKVAEDADAEPGKSGFRYFLFIVCAAGIFATRLNSSVESCSSLFIFNSKYWLK